MIIIIIIYNKKDLLGCFQNVILDVCSLDQELTLLQQGCEITGGNYLQVPQLAGLLQYLLVNYLYLILYLFYTIIN